MIIFGTFLSVLVARYFDRCIATRVRSDFITGHGEHEFARSSQLDAPPFLLEGCMGENTGSLSTTCESGREVLRAPLDPEEVAHFREKGWVLYEEREVGRSEQSHVWRERVLYEYLKRAKQLNPDIQPAYPDPHRADSWTDGFSVKKLFACLGRYFGAKSSELFHSVNGNRESQSASFQNLVVRPVFQGPGWKGAMLRSNGREDFEVDLVKKTVLIWNRVKAAKPRALLSGLDLARRASTESNEQRFVAHLTQIVCGANVNAEGDAKRAGDAITFADYVAVMKELQKIEAEFSACQSWGQRRSQKCCEDVEFSKFLSFDSAPTRAMTRLFFSKESVDALWAKMTGTAENSAETAQHNAERAKKSAENFQEVSCSLPDLAAVPYNSFERKFLTEGPIPAALDQLHRLYQGNVVSGQHSGRRWRYDNPAHPGLGWAHVRYPRGRGFLSRHEKIPASGWHVDRGDANSMVVFPLVTNLKAGGGATAVISGSHLSNLALLRKRRRRPSEPELFIRAHINANLMSPTENLTFTHPTTRDGIIPAGSVLFMHPLLQHSATTNSLATRTENWRVGFNIRTCWV